MPHACAARSSSSDPVAQHLSEVEAVADGMLARLDELTATLGTVRRCSCRAHSPRADAARSQVSGDAAQQQAMLAPAYSSITAGLARDFAYIDGVGVRLLFWATFAERAHASWR